MEPPTSYSPQFPLPVPPAWRLSNADPHPLPLPFNDPQLDLGGHDYKLLQPTEEEAAAVRHLFAQRPPEGYEIASVQRVYAPRRTQNFLCEIEDLQSMGSASLDWAEEDKLPENKERRKKVWELFKQTVNPYTSHKYSSVHFLPLWHGTQSNSLDSILKAGYRYSGVNDLGYFGKGLYFTEEAAYASLYSKEEGVLLLNWIVTRSTYPVIHEDQEKLLGKAKYKNYDSHFVPVVPTNPLYAAEMCHEALRSSQVYRYKELVVFQTGAALPRYVVTIRKIAEKIIIRSQNALFQLFQLLQYRLRQNISVSDIQEAWKNLINPRLNSSSSSSLEEDTDNFLSSRNLFEKILLYLLSTYTPDVITPDFQSLLNRMGEKCLTNRSLSVLESALNLFYHSSSWDFTTLDKIHWLMLFPLQFVLPLNQEIDLVEEAFKGCFSALKKGENAAKFHPLMKHLAEVLVQISENEEILKFYLKLSPYPDLRHAFFMKLESLKWPDLHLLLPIPDVTGFRFSFKRDQNNLQESLTALMGNQPHKHQGLPQVKIRFFFEGQKREGFLDSKVIECLSINEKGDIHKFYKEASHAVARVELDNADLHLKQNPVNPWMEHAVHSLMYRIAGRLTPSTQLVRLEVIRDSKTKVYPVQISQTIKGKTLKDLTGLDRWEQLGETQKAQWTWLFLCSIITQPGDGRNSNYIVDDAGNIFCIDNEISFTEPVISHVFGKKSVSFGAAPFCYFKETTLDRETLDQFAKLDVRAILDAWVEDLLNDEHTSGESGIWSLFSQDDINQFKGDYIYKKYLLLREGTLAKLNLQFLYLQEFVKHALLRNERICALDLLKVLVTLRGDVNFQSTVGGYVQDQYLNAFKEKRQARLNWILGRTLSLTQKDADKAHYGTVLTKEKVAGAKEYRLEIARQELHISLLGKSINFKGIGPERQLKLLKALRQQFQHNKPTNITLNHSSELNQGLLEPLLHPDLLHLDLSYCPKVDTRCLELIQKICPRLQELHLTGCSGLRALALWSPLAWNLLEFSHLKVLKAQDCPNLVAVRLKLPMLETFDARNNPLIDDFSLECPRLNSDNPDVDLRGSPGLPLEIKIAYKKTVLEILDREEFPAGIYNLNQAEVLLKLIDPILRDDEDIVLKAVQKNPKTLRLASQRLKNNSNIVSVAVSRNLVAFEYADPSLKKDREFILRAVSQNGDALEYADPSLKKDRDFILQAVSRNLVAFEYADPSLKKDREFILRAVSQNGDALQYADPILKADEEIVLVAVSKDGHALEHADPSLKKDREFILRAVSQNGDALQYADPILKADKEIVLAAVSQSGLAFKYADPSLKKDREFILQVVSKNGYALQYADPILKADKEIVLVAVSKGARAFEYADPSLKKDREFILQAVSKNGDALQYVDPILKADKEIVLAAISQNSVAFKYADPSLKEDRRFILQAVSHNGLTLRYADPILKADREIVLFAVSRSGHALEYADPSLKKDREFILQAVSRDGKALEYADPILKADREIVLAAISQNSVAFQYVDPSLKKDREIVLVAVSRNGYMLKYADPSLKKDREIVLVAVSRDGYVLQYADPSLKTNREFLWAVMDNKKGQVTNH